MRRRRDKRRRDRHNNHFQRIHEHSTRGAERPDPDDCACNGSGWILSSCDVWEKCSVHYDGQEHPEHRASEAERKVGHEIFLHRRREEQIGDLEQGQGVLHVLKNRGGSPGPDLELAGFFAGENSSNDDPEGEVEAESGTDDDGGADPELPF